MSRLTGFVRTVVVLGSLSGGLLGDAYNTANVPPNIVYDLLLAGVLSGVGVPLLVLSAIMKGSPADQVGRTGLVWPRLSLARAIRLPVLANP